MTGSSPPPVEGGSARPLGDTATEVSFLLKHSTIYGLGNLLSRAVAFVLLPFYTRYLTPADYGVLELIDVTSSLIAIVLNLGIASAMGRFYYDLESSDQRSFIGTVYVLAGAVCIMTLVPFLLVAPWVATHILDSADYAPHFQVAFAALVVGIIGDIGITYLRLRYRSTSIIVLSLVSMVLAVYLNVLFIVRFSMGPLGVLASGLITRAVIGIPLVMAVLYRTGLHFNVRFARAMLSYSLPLIPSTLGTTVVGYSDRYLLKHFGSIADTGIYGIAVRVSSSLHMLITAPFFMTYVPRRFQIARRVDAPYVFRRVYDIYILGLVVPATLLAVFIPEIMRIMTSPAYYAAGDLVPILLLELVAIGSRYHFEFGILYSNRTQYYSWINGIVACSHIALAFVLIRSYGMWGAAIAAVLSSSLQAGLLYVASQRLYNIPFDLGRNAKALAVSASTVLTAQFVQGHAGSTTVAVAMKVALAIGFVALTIRLQELQVDDFRRFGQALRGTLAHAGASEP